MCEEHSKETISRRGLLGGGLALSMAAMAASPALSQSTEAPPATPDEALQRLKDGNARYVANTPMYTDHTANRISRSQGQAPFAAIVACSDSRVIPELIFDQGPGDLFIVRVAGNFINDDGVASLEFGAAVLGVKTIVVLGHGGCGAVVATIDSIKDRVLPPGHLPSLVNAIRPAVYDAMADNPSDLLEAATAENAKLNAKKASEAYPILSELHTAGKVKSAAAVYEISTGKVNFL